MPVMLKLKIQGKKKPENLDKISFTALFGDSDEIQKSAEFARSVLKDVPIDNEVMNTPMTM